MSLRSPGQLVLVLLSLSVLTHPAFGQEPSTEAPPHVMLIDGAATLEREGRAEPATANLPLLPGDRLRTDAGRLEILFPDGSALYLDNHTVVDLLAPTLLRLLEGRVSLIVAAPAESGPGAQYRIDAPAAAIRIEAPGEYRVALLTGAGVPELELAVLRGAAELANDRGATPVRAGERSVVRAGSAPSFPYAFNSAYFDAFDQWVQHRRGARTGAASGRYLPHELRAYTGVFDYHGSWAHDPLYGYVWYPRVAPTWRPYHHGRWGSSRASAGPGSASTRGRGRRTTSAAGGCSTDDGSGLRRAGGRPPGCTGRSRPATSGGVPSASTADPSSTSRTPGTTRGTPGASCRRRRSARRRSWRGR